VQKGGQFAWPEMTETRGECGFSGRWNGTCITIRWSPDVRGRETRMDDDMKLYLLLVAAGFGLSGLAATTASAQGGPPEWVRERAPQSQNEARERARPANDRGKNNGAAAGDNRCAPGHGVAAGTPAGAVLARVFGPGGPASHARPGCNGKGHERQDGAMERGQEGQRDGDWGRERGQREGDLGRDRGRQQERPTEGRGRSGEHVPQDQEVRGEAPQQRGARTGRADRGRPGRG
jgi:hypothetical protein